MHNAYAEGNWFFIAVVWYLDNKGGEQLLQILLHIFKWFQSHYMQSFILQKSSMAVLPLRQMRQHLTLNPQIYHIFYFSALNTAFCLYFWHFWLFLYGKHLFVLKITIFVLAPFTWSYHSPQSLCLTHDLAPRLPLEILCASLKFLRYWFACLSGLFFAVILCGAEVLTDCGNMVLIWKYILFAPAQSQHVVK